MVLLDHELQRRQREIDLVGVVLVHQRDARGAAAHHLARRRREIAELSSFTNVVLPLPFSPNRTMRDFESIENSAPLKSGAVDPG